MLSRSCCRQQSLRPGGSSLHARPTTARRSPPTHPPKIRPTLPSAPPGPDIITLYNQQSLSNNPSRPRPAPAPAPNHKTHTVKEKIMSQTEKRAST